MKKMDRRDFFKKTVGFAGLSLVMPVINACGSKPEETKLILPLEKPKNWNPVEFNRLRGNNGAIPESYLSAINGPDGAKKHIGKHLPYIPEFGKNIEIPAGYLPIMWGDPSKGHAQHSNAVPGADNNYLGHWYNRIEIRKSTSAFAESVTSSFSGWPANNENGSGLYMASHGGNITDAGGIYTVYLAKIPSDVKKGDTVRILAHCLTHGEYVDFVTI